MLVNKVQPGVGVCVCCEDCCHQWVACVAVATDAGIPVFTESKDMQPTHTWPETSA